MKLKNDGTQELRRQVSSPRIIVPATSGIGRGSATLKSRQESRDEDAASAKYNEAYAKAKQSEQAEVTSESIQSD